MKEEKLTIQIKQLNFRIIMIIVNTRVTVLEDSVYVADCPQCDEQFLVYLYPKYMCPHCCTFIPDILGIVNTSVIKLRYYFDKDPKIRSKTGCFV